MGTRFLESAKIGRIIQLTTEQGLAQPPRGKMFARISHAVNNPPWSDEYAFQVDVADLWIYELFLWRKIRQNVVDREMIMIELRGEMPVELEPLEKRERPKLNLDNFKPRYDKFVRRFSEDDEDEEGVGE